MRTLLIHHRGDQLSSEGITGWLASFSELVGVVEIDEPRQRRWKRIRREWKRVGLLRLLDVLAFRVYYKLAWASSDAAYRQATIQRLGQQYPAAAHSPPIHATTTPNSPETEAFIKQQAPDLVVARCKTLLRSGIFAIPPHGTLIMHPGICPMYRNSHGCFWAMASDDFDNVGMTLLKIDRGIDTGPIYGHFRCPFDPLADSHVKIQTQVVIENLAAVRDKLLEIQTGTAETIDTAGWPSKEFGQPWLSAYLRYRRAAKQRSHA